MYRSAVSEPNPTLRSIPPKPRPSEPAPPQEVEEVEHAQTSSSDGAGKGVLDALLNVAAQNEAQRIRRQTAIAYAIAATGVPLYSGLDVLFGSLDPHWHLPTTLIMRFSVAFVLAVGALRLRRAAATVREVDVWFTSAPVTLTGG